MNNYRGMPLFVFAIAGIAILNCTSPDRVASGSSSETVVGKIANAGGTPAGNTKVTLYPDTYNPVAAAPLPDSSSDTTNDSGEYAIKVPDSSVRYNIQAVNISQLTRVLITGIAILGDTTYVPEATLTVPGTIKLLLPDSVDNVNGYVYIPGTGIVANLFGNNGFVILDSVPAGIVPAIYYGVRNSSVGKVLHYNIPVSPGDTVIVWKYSRQITLNTTTSGAGVAGNVIDFPVLVRLTTGNFNFAQANADGSDLRFAKPDGSPLPYEIERWDASQARAEVWVRVDTVFGSDNSQYVTMYWGNSGATDSSSGGAVFNTVDGFEGVWHLDSTGNDATVNNHSGTYVATTDTVGIIGHCQKFTVTAYARISGLLNTPSVVTLSAWALLNRPDIIGSEVVSVGDAVLIRMDDSWKNKGTQGAYCVNPFGGADSTHCVAQSGQFMQQTGWHYLAYSVDIANRIQSLYIDGAVCCSTDSTVSIRYTNVGSDTYFGRHGNGRTGFNFIGNIDEVRVDKTVRSADWIKLCYMNQRTDDKLVVFK